MKLDILIKNGHVVDPHAGIDTVKDIGVINDKIVDVKNGDFICDNVVNADGCFVFPGLIDYHCHVYNRGSYWGLNPEWLLATGVTSVVDPGTSGFANYEAFKNSIINYTNMNIKSYISVFPGGLFDDKFHQIYDPEYFNEEKIKFLKSKYPDDILGLKIMLSKNQVGNNAADILKMVVDMADRIGDLSVCVHTTNPAASIEEICEILRPGDIYVHCFHGNGDNIIDNDGKVRKCVKDARERGVIFDAANGGMHFSNEVAQAALKDEFLPDIISSDLTTTTLNKSNKLKTLPFIMSRYLSLGVPMNDLIKTTTEIPARLMKMEDKIGTLKEGSYADISIFKLKDQEVKHIDFEDKEYIGKYLLVPQMTVSKGNIAFCQIDFNI